MKNTLSIALVFSLGFFPIFSHAEEGFVGENPGLNFYTTIDQGNYTIQEKLMKVRLAETPSLDQFGKNCINDVLWLQGIPTDAKVLSNLENGYYGEISEALAKNKVSISSDTFQELTRCLVVRYQQVRERTERENGARVTLSSLGLYMDGDTSNSDYDILSDIEKINSLIFSEALKYGGVTNKSSKNFADLLAGKSPAPLFPSGTTNATGTTSNTGTNTPPGNTGTTSQNNSPNTPNNTSPSNSLASLIGPSCTTTGSLGNIGDITSDPYFVGELANLLAGGNTGTPSGNGYTPGNASGTPGNGNNSAGNTNNPNQNPTKDASTDFFHKMPCTSIFCIKVTMVGGSENALGGGKNISIEGILDKHHKILEPISESALRDEKMTNNSFSLPFFNLKLPSTIAGLRVYLANSPQVTRRDKRDETPEKKKEDLEQVRRCAQASVGLPTDLKKANSLIGAGYMPTRSATSETITNRSSALGAQEAAELARYTNCMESLVSGGRLTYYDSFSTDLTEIQTFTNAMMKSIDEMMTLGVKLNNKPVK